ncbi:MAG TPA: hypothetical protein PKH16_00140 [Aequorivita sp.]|nr:hypothetical protein [Aequorivita sp.]
MILIITHKQDYTVDFVINKLNQKGILYKRLNCEDLISINYIFDSDNHFSFSFDGIKRFDSVWFRRTKFPEINDLKQEEKLYILNEYDSLLKNIFATIDAKWLSEPRHVYNAENKVLQLKVAQKIGLNIPRTIITNDKRKIKEFYLKNNRDIIIKPLAHTRINYNNNAAFIFTNLVSKDLMDSIDDYDINPCIFQENIKKDYEIRVTVVDKKVFASAVHSQDHENTKYDWRKEKLDFHPAQLPKKISDKCITLLRELNIKFGAIDLIKTPDDNYVFLEVNPNGQWAWIEMQTGQKISDEIIKFLKNAQL